MRLSGMLRLSLVLLVLSAPLWAQAPAPEAPVRLLSVRSAKVLYGEREPVIGLVAVANDRRSRVPSPPGWNGTCIPPTCPKPVR